MEGLEFDEIKADRVLTGQKELKEARLYDRVPACDTSSRELVVTMERATADNHESS